MMGWHARWENKSGMLTGRRPQHVHDNSQNRPLYKRIEFGFRPMDEIGLQDGCG